MNTVRLCVVSFLTTTCFTLVDVRAENWPQWRGPLGDGVTPELDTPTTWSKDANVVWRVPLPEDGNSTPVVWGNRVFLTQPLSDAKQRVLMCFSRQEGRLLWQKGVTYGAEEASHRTNPYCSASPATDGQYVTVWFGSAGLFCYDMQGKEQWRRDLGPQDHMWGYGTSPILHGELCILNFGPGQHEMLLAVDKKTGEDVWRVEPLSLAKELELSGPENNGNVDPRRDGKELQNMLRGAWSTPVVVDVAGRKELIVTHPRRVSAYAPSSGKLLWTCGGLAPLAYVSPMRSGETIVALGGYFGGSLAVRAGGQGDVSRSARVWHKERDGNYLGTGVVRDDHAFVCTMDGIVRCLEVDTGKEVWKTRLDSSSGRGQTWGSMTMTQDGIIYLLTQNGDTFVFQASSEGYQQIARNSLGESTNSSVVISDSQLFLRTFDALWCIGAN